MPYANGRITIDTSTDPDLGVAIYDIQRALGTSVYNDIGGLITAVDGNSKPLVNKWAKFKPIRSASFILNGLERSSGLYLPYYKQIGTMVEDVFNNRWINAENYDANRVPWEWEKPRGFSVTPREPFRILDFNGYYANAQPFAGAVPSPLIVPVSDTTATFYWPYSYDSGAIAPADLVESGGLVSTTRYLGVCLFTGVQSNQRKVYTLQAVSQYNDATIHHIQGDWSNASVGIYHAFLFISDKQITLGGTEPTGNFIPILLSYSDVTVQMEQWKLRNLVLTASQSQQSVTVGWSVDLQNTGGKSATIEYHYYYEDPNTGETEFTPSYSTTVNLSAGTNTGSYTRNSVNKIISKVTVTISITDSVHGNDSITASKTLL